MVICSSASKNPRLETPAELGVAVFHRLERSHAIGVGKAVEILAVGLARPIVRRGNAGAEEFARIERQLIAELRLCLGERSVAIKPRACAVSAGKLAVDEGGDAAIAARRRQLVGRDHGIGGRGKERVLGCGQSQQRLAADRLAPAQRPASGLRFAAAGGASDAATAVPAPIKKLRRRIGLVSSAMAPSLLVYVQTNAVVQPGSMPLLLITAAAGGARSEI